jgi:hypothetical protein
MYLFLYTYVLICVNAPSMIRVTPFKYLFIAGSRVCSVRMRIIRKQNNLL